MMIIALLPVIKSSMSCCRSY